MFAHTYRSKLPRFVQLVLLLGLFMAMSSGGAAQEPGQPAGNPVYVYLPLLSLRNTPQWLGPYGGLISAVVVDPITPQNVYAGSWGGGVYKSVDGGSHWSSINQGLDNLVVVSLGIDPVSPSILYAGTYKGKVYKSTNAGASWVFSSQGIQEEAIVYSIAIDPGNTQRVYLATRGISNNGNQPWAGVIYRSDDGGASWVPKLTNLGGSGYQDYMYMIKVNPSAHNIIYAATHEHGIVKSTDFGDTWDIKNNGISNLSTRAIVIDPRVNYKNTVYTGIWEKQGVYKTDDGGNYWALKNVGISGANIYGMAINPGAPKTLFAATYNMGVMKSTDSSNSWSNSGLKDASVDTIVIDPTNTLIVFSGTAGDGLYVSRDNGGSWSHSQSGLQASSITGLVVSPDDPAVYFASIEGGGVVWSQDRGASWADLSSNLGDKYIHALVKNPASKIIYALTDRSGLYQCDLTNIPGCWTPVGISLQAGVAAEPGARIPRPFNSQDTFLDLLQPGGLVNRGVNTAASSVPLRVLTFALSNSQIAYMGLDSAGVYKSTNGGGSWAPTTWRSNNVLSIAIHPNNPQMLYASTDQPGSIRTSINGGDNWTDIPFPGVYIYSLAISPVNPDILLAGTSNGVYRWDGNSWIESGLAGQVIDSLQVDPRHSNIVIAGTKGAFISYDAGSTWQPGPDELTGISVQAVGFDPYDAGTLFYLTTAQGILRAGLGN